MPTTTYYLDSSTLTNATAVFLDSNLTQCAPDQYYSDGINVRRQVGCKLEPSTLCPSCLPPCGTSINASGQEGVYRAQFSTGSSLGALIIRLEPFNIPDGIRAKFQGETTYYNRVASNLILTSGFQAPPGRFSFSGDDCSCLPAGSNRTLTVFQYNGSSFVNTGTSDSIFIDRNTDCSGGGSGPNFMTLVVPKSLPSQNLVEIEVAGACGGTEWDITVSCPVILTSYLRSNPAADAGTACGLPTIRPYYFVSVQQSPNMSIVNRADFVYTDPYGQNPLPNGFYRVSNGGGNNVIQVVDGNVVAKTNC